MTSISSSSSSSSSFFTQFRIYCSSLERDAKKLRKSVEAVKTGGPSAVSSISLSGSEQDDAESYLDNIEDSCKMYEQKMLDIDQRIHGSLDNRLSLINSKDILEKCTKLYEANQLMMTKLDEYISKFDANKKPLVATAELKLKHAQAVNNIENQENIININTNEIDTITTIDNDDNVNEEEAAHDLTTNGSTLCDGIENDEDDLESESCHEEVEGGDIGDISVKVDDIVLSPVASRSSEKIVDNKTPTLLDWKLSDATRKIVNIKGTVSPQNNSYNDDDIIETPQKFQSTFNNDSTDTPTTPTIGTPFQTCDLKASYRHSYMTSTRNRSPEITNDDVFENSISPLRSVNLDNVKKEETIIHDANSPMLDEHNVSKDSDTSDTSIGFISPPKMAKILEPRKHETTSNSIPLISDEEWSTAPVFLKKQVTLDIVNKALISINSILIDSEKRDTLSQTEMDETISKLVEVNIPPKAVILALVQLKKLDLGTDSNKQKVYKIRRFY